MDNSVDTDPSEYAMGDYGSKANYENSPHAKEFVSNLVENNRVVVFSKSQCPHCDTSKSLLSDLGVEFKAIELDKMKDGSEVQTTLGEMTNARTVPRIFIDGQCVGGNSDLQNLNSSGVLVGILNKADIVKQQ